MRQAWHIFKKDSLYLYREIAFLFALAALFGWLARAQARYGGDASDALELLYVAAVAFTVARLIHAEAIPGENQFWVTRPYRWRSLLTAKILFVTTFVQLPVFVVQTLILLINGFPPSSIVVGLFWTQVLIATGILLPCLALAAMTAGLVPFIATILVLFTVGFFTVESSYRYMMLAPESVDWVRHSIPFIAALIAAPPVLYLQYRYRLTRYSEPLLASVTLCGTLLAAFLPWPALFAVQSLISKQSFPVEITRDATRPFDPKLYSDGVMPISLPLKINGVPDAVRPQIEMYDLQLRRADGRTMHLNAAKLAFHRDESDAHELVLYGTVFPGRGFLEGARGQAVTLHLVLYLTLYGNIRDKTIPFQTTPVNALDGLRCADEFADEVVCRAPFRWPGRLVSVKSPSGGLASFTHLISYSPFPANLQLDPVAMRSAGPYWSNDKRSARQVTIEIEEPLQYLRREIDVPYLFVGGH